MSRYRRVRQFSRRTRGMACYTSVMSRRQKRVAPGAPNPPKGTAPPPPKDLQPATHPESFLKAPRVFAQYTQCSIQNDGVMLTFSQTHHISDETGQEMQLLLPQAICFMTLGHFLRFAEMVERQVKKIRQQAEEQGIRLEDDGEA